METYGDKVRLVFRDFPLAMHKDAQLAAEAAQCAGEQGRFWDYHDKLFANQRALGAEQLKQYGTELSLGDEFAQCIVSGKYKNQVLQDVREGQQIGVTGTPAFFINGRFLSGAQPYETFARIIDEELQTGSATN